jgi:hypothetical protein
VPIWKAPTYNSPSLNWKRGMYAMSTSLFIVRILSRFHNQLYFKVTPMQHIQSTAKILNQFYEWPKTR